MSTVITENTAMSPKERILEIIGNFTERITEELDTAHTQYGRLRRNEEVEYKEVRKADMNCSRLEGQKEAFELIANVLDKEIPDMDYVPKSIEIVRIDRCKECTSSISCIAKHYTSYQKTQCPDKKW